MEEEQRPTVTEAPNRAVARIQKRNVFILCGVVVVIVFAVILNIYLEGKATPKAQAPSTTHIKNLATVSEQIDAETTWQQLSESKLKNVEGRLSEIDTLKATLVKAMQESSEKEAKVQALDQQVKVLTDRLEQQDQNVAALKEDSLKEVAQTDTFNGMGVAEPALQSLATMPQVLQDEIVSESLQIAEPNAHSPKHAHNYVPAGAFVRAVLIQGIDASASLSASSDPRPVLIRLVDHGSLPNEVKSHIQDCRMIGGAFGDISSERVFIRVENFSCTLKDNSIIEAPISGYVAGEDGKVGVRGIVVRREADLLQDSFVSGALAGIGKGVSEGYTTSSISPLGVTQTVPGQDVLKYGVSEGASSAMDRLSKYHIERAEQYQPVIQVAAGREVNVIFNKGFFLHQGQDPLSLAGE